ncbi:GATA zinc finger domain-containing protein 14-like [Drosophila bipectinata]|uniref:GATA zinc finger domain-containing protein 14-like n=1 Tax=Drosophila bipectinata TaxID=42026 RepID=UPI0038B3E10A
MNKEQVSVKQDVGETPGEFTRSKRRRMQRKRAKIVQSITSPKTESKKYDIKPRLIKTEPSDSTGTGLIIGGIKTEGASPGNRKRQSLNVEKELCPGMVKIKLEVSDIPSKLTASSNVFPELKENAENSNQSKETKDGLKVLQVNEINKVLPAPESHSGAPLKDVTNLIPNTNVEARILPVSTLVASPIPANDPNTLQLDQVQYQLYCPFDPFNNQNQQFNHVQSLPSDNQCYPVNNQGNPHFQYRWNSRNNWNSNWNRSNNQINPQRQQGNFRIRNWNQSNPQFNRQIEQRRSENWYYQTTNNWNSYNSHWNNNGRYGSGPNRYQNWNSLNQNYNWRNTNFQIRNNCNSQERSYQNQQQTWYSSNHYFNQRQPHWNAQNWNNRRWNHNQHQHVNNEFQFHRMNHPTGYHNFNGSQTAYHFNTQSQYQNQPVTYDLQLNCMTFRTQHSNFGQMGNPPNQTSSFVNWQGPRTQGNFYQHYRY